MLPCTMRLGGSVREVSQRNEGGHCTCKDFLELRYALSGVYLARTAAGELMRSIWWDQVQEMEVPGRIVGASSAYSSWSGEEGRQELA